MTSCPVCCESTDLGSLGRAGDYELRWCPRCRLRFSDPMREGDAAFYASLYLYDQRAPESVTLDVASTADWRHRTFLERCPAVPGASLLDVGCGDGAFLDLARAHGYDVAGVDLDERGILLARERRGVARVACAHWSTLSERREGWRDFHVVTAFELLEHLADPVAFLAAVRSVLRPGGVACLSVPSFDRRPALFDPSADAPPHHLTLWTREALAAAFTRAGFGSVEVLVRPLSAEDFRVQLAWAVRRWKGAGAPPAPSSSSPSPPPPPSPRSPFVRALYMVPLGVAAGFMRLVGYGRGSTLLALGRTSG